MKQYENLYVLPKYRNQSGGLEQLKQLLRIVHDGDLINKGERDELVKLGFAQRANGFNIITPDGIEFLKKSKIIHS